jgi:hypothetical protein
MTVGEGDRTTWCLAMDLPGAAVGRVGELSCSFRHLKVAAKPPSKDARRGAGLIAILPSPSKLAELVVGPATLGRTRWLAIQD